MNWSHDDALIATASRENKKSVKIWKQSTEEIKESDQAVKFEQVSMLPSGAVACATALRFFPQLIGGKYAMVVGQESGELTVWRWDETDWTLLHKVH